MAMYITDNACEISDYENEARSTLVSRNVTIDGHRTSVRLEPEMWTALREIAKREKCSIHDICTLISLKKKMNTSLTAAIRVFLMLYYRAASTESGHAKAGHGNIVSMKARAQMDHNECKDSDKKNQKYLREILDKTPKFSSAYYQ